ncbi:MAG: dienelactone hydrolase family protein [Actinobacteria bacterium]|nr:dienelactone hydrolase family protein [Actinomycetota bacterium]
MRLALTLLAAAALLAGCGSSHAPGLFDYDASKPLAYVDHGPVTAKTDTIAIHDVAYTSLGRRVQGYLVEPAGAKKLPAVVMVTGGGGDRSQLVVEARFLAQRNVVVLTITPPSTLVTSTPTTGAALLAQARSITVGDVVAVRRAVDVLQTLPSVDPHRIGYLGWSLGAKTGTYVAESEPRVEALALLSAGADPISAFIAHAPASLRKQARTVLGSIDPLAAIKHAHGDRLLLEDGTRDEVIPRTALRNVIAAAPHGTTVRWFDATHALNRKAYDAAFSWLGSKL